MSILKTIFPHKTSTSQTVANCAMISLFESLIVTSMSFNSAREISLVFFVKWSIRLMIGEPCINRRSHSRRPHRVIYYRTKEILNGLAYQRPDKKHRLHTIAWPDIYLFSAFCSYLLDTHDRFDKYITCSKLLFNLRLIVASWTFA